MSFLFSHDFSLLFLLLFPSFSFQSWVHSFLAFSEEESLKIQATSKPVFLILLEGALKRKHANRWSKTVLARTILQEPVKRPLQKPLPGLAARLATQYMQAARCLRSTAFAGGQKNTRGHISNSMKWPKAASTFNHYKKIWMVQNNDSFKLLRERFNESSSWIEAGQNKIIVQKMQIKDFTLLLQPLEHMFQSSSQQLTT